MYQHNVLPQSFNFSKVSLDDVLKEINKIGDRKAIQNTDIPVKIIKQNADIFGSYICHFFNVCVNKGTFPSVLKHADITPVIYSFEFPKAPSWDHCCLIYF